MLMTLVNDILKQMPGLSQPQRKFLATLFVTILVLRGRVNFRNLSRYCDYSERTIARQFREPFDWPDFHQRVLITSLDPHCAPRRVGLSPGKGARRHWGSGTSSTAVRVVPNAGWRFPRSPWWMSPAG